jgi:hypothetical protein
MLIGDIPDSSTELAPTDVRKIAISWRRMSSSMSWTTWCGRAASPAEEVSEDQIEQA